MPAALILRDVRSCSMPFVSIEPVATSTAAFDSATSCLICSRNLSAVEATPYDFRKPRAIGGTVVDHAFTHLAEGRVRITGPEGSLELTWDVEIMPWVQVCTGTGLGHRGLAVEPMTCPPDAFNSGTDLVVLKPGDTHQATWTLART